MDQVLPGYAEVCILFRLTDFIFHSSIKPFKSKALSYRNQSTDLQCKSMYWFLYDGNICLKLVRLEILSFSQLWVTCRVFLVKCYWKWIFLVSFWEHISETNGAIKRYKICLFFDFFRMSCFMNMKYWLAEPITKSLNVFQFWLIFHFSIFKDFIDFVDFDFYGFRDFIK